MFSLPDLPYDYNALEPHIDEATMRIHHDKHHAAYVSNLNAALEGQVKLLNMDVTELLRNLAKVPEEIRTKVRNNGGGHANHSLFWAVMGPGGNGRPEGPLADAIDAAFADFRSFQEKFKEKAMGRFGSGWAWLVLENGSLSLTDTPNQDTPPMEAVPAGSPRVEAGRQGKMPILGIDVWEHAYYLKYQNRRAEYIDAWWNVVNWQEVQRRFEESAPV